MTLSAALLIAAQIAAVGTPPAGDTIQVPQMRSQPVVTATTKRSPVVFDADRFDSLTASALRGLFDDALELGLPVRPLVNRALEGAARRVPSERIVRVVREHAAALHQAKRALGDPSREDELEAAAIALRAGLNEDAVESMRASRGRESVVVPLVVLTDLVRRGVPMANAQTAVARLARVPRSDDLLLGLQATVAKNAQRGPGMALDALNRYVQSTGATPAAVAPISPDRKPVRPPEP
jgi:hypothetical protein